MLIKKIVICFIGIIIISCTNKNDGRTVESLIIKLEQVVQEVNDSCPIRTDEVTMLESCYSDGLDITYVYSIDTDLAKDQFDVDFSLDSENLTALQTELIIEHFCQHPDLQIYRDNDVTMTWKYYDYSENNLSSVSANNSDCK